MAGVSWWVASKVVLVQPHTAPSGNLQAPGGTGQPGQSSPREASSEYVL